MPAAPAHFAVVIRILRQAETDETIDLVYRRHIVSKATFHRWKRIYRDMELADDKRLKQLKKRLIELLLKESVLEEVNAGCVGPVAIWMYINLRIDIRQILFRPNNASYTSGTWCCRGNILMLICLLLLWIFSKLTTVVWVSDLKAVLAILIGLLLTPVAGNAVMAREAIRRLRSTAAFGLMQFTFRASHWG
jgi:hypothetical protein